MKAPLLTKIISSIAWITMITGVYAQQSSTTPATAVKAKTSSSFEAVSDKEQELKSKEVSQEINMPKNGEIYIESSYRSIQVKTWDQQKVKLSTTAYYEGDGNLTDAEWFERMNISMRTLGSSVKIKSGGVGSGYTYAPFGATAYTLRGGQSITTIIDGNAQRSATRSTTRRLLTIHVPSGSKLDIETKYADVQLPAGIGDVFLDITNGNFEAEDIGKLVLRSKYSNANVGDVKTAELEFINGRFSAKNIDELDIDSKYATIELAAVKKIMLRSTNDEYELEDADEVSGRKNYGNLRITKLNKSVELDGTNADVKIRNLGPAVSLIKIDNRYADIRVPLRNIKNYSIDFSGAYSSVYGNFEKIPVTATAGKEKDEKEKKSTTDNTVVYDGNSRLTTTNQATIRVAQIASADFQAQLSGSSHTPSRFTASMGDGKGIKIEMKCQNCTVDFK